MKWRTLSMGLACLAALSTLSQAQTSSWVIDPAHSSVQFVVRHLGVSNIHGSINGVKGTVFLDAKDITHSAVSATMDAATVTTSNDYRDKDLKSPNFFDVSKYPELAFKSTGINQSGGKLHMTGDLTLAGVTKPVTLDVDGPSAPQKGPSGKTISGFSASGTLKRTDFNFGSKYGSAMIGDDVKFTIDVEIDKQ